MTHGIVAAIKIKAAQQARFDQSAPVVLRMKAPA